MPNIYTTKKWLICKQYDFVDKIPLSFPLNAIVPHDLLKATIVHELELYYNVRNN